MRGNPYTGSSGVSSDPLRDSLFPEEHLSPLLRSMLYYLIRWLAGDAKATASSL